MDHYTFDYVIVGGGTAGCVLASRLSDSQPTKSILLVEAGPENDSRIAPALGLAGSPALDITWNHISIPQKQLGSKTVDQPQGKVLGGSSAINYQCWTRGAAADFNRWSVEVGDKRWSWQGMLPYFIRSESFVPGTDIKDNDLSQTHGSSGPIKVSQITSSGRPRNYPMREAVAAMYDSAGSSKILDGNGGQVVGYSEGSFSTYDGIRQWASAYPRGPNVTLWSNTLALKLSIKGKQVTGVELMKEGEVKVEVVANEEVIVSSGSQGSPKLLLLSGIGPLEELEKHGIESVLQLPVGQNYSDHPMLATYWHLRDRGLTLGDVEMITSECNWTSGLPYDWVACHRHEELEDFAKEHLDSQELERFATEGIAHTESIILYGHFDFTGTVGAAPTGSNICVLNLLVHPFSRGTITLRSADPLDAPLLDPNVLSNEVDTQLLYSVARLTSKAVEHTIGPKYGATEYAIDEGVQNDYSDSAMRKRVLRMVRTINHGSGACAMGSVVDTECRVLGIQGLRVVDSSVFPIPLSGHYQAAVYALAEQMAEILNK